VRVFAKGESDAARFAELIAAELLAQPAGATETPQAYFARFMPRLRVAAEKELRLPLKDAPLASYPTAAATWLRVRNGGIETATLGDTVALVLSPKGALSVLGETGKPAEEQARAKKVMTMSPEERLKWLQNVRAIHNTGQGYWVFGVQPEAASHIVYETAEAPPGTRVLLMTDGFYRLVSPYGRYDDAGLMDAVLAKGLGVVLAELRGMEASPEDDAKIGRFKTSDDATALLLEC
jgi:hypothetical protein